MKQNEVVKVTLHGAAGEVTGSAYLVETDTARVLVDFGLFQGSRECEDCNSVPPKLDAEHLDAVVLTHAHLDHTGRLPLLARAGYSGPIFGTAATNDLTELVLRDAAKVQQADTDRRNRHLKEHEEPAVPLYTLADVETVLGLRRQVPYLDPVPVAPGITARFLEAGHMLGSTSIQLEVQSRGQTRHLVFSGDLGPHGAPILKDFEPFTHADLVFLESTYGDRDHRAMAGTLDEFAAIMQEAIARKAKVLVPTFAIGRAQVILTILAGMFRSGRLPEVPVFLDSPMAIEATRIMGEHPELFDEEMTAFLKEGSITRDLRSLRLCETADESKAINNQPGPCVVLAGSGMCNAGRILHHLKFNLGFPETAVIFVGYQGEGSLGRRLINGDKEVRIFGEAVAVKAKIYTLGGFSAHAGQSDLMKWFSAVAAAKPRVVLTHGEDRGRLPLAKLIRQRFGLDPVLPQRGDTVWV